MSTKLERRYESARKSMANARARAKANKQLLVGDAVTVATAVTTGAADGYFGGDDRVISVEEVPVSPIVGGVLGVAGMAIGGTAGMYVGRAGVGMLCYGLGNVARDLTSKLADD